MNLDSVLLTFIAESREVLHEMENRLLAVESSPGDSETLNAIFRAAHTVKGSAGLFDLDHIVTFTHVVETVLDGLRKGELTVSKDLVALLLESCDHVRSLIDAVAEGRREEDADSRAAAAGLLERLRRYAAAPEAATRVRSSVDRPPGGAGPAGVVDGSHWHISVRFGRDLLRNGMDPLSLIGYLGRLGTIKRIETLFDAGGLVEEMDPESCYLGVEIAFESGADKSTIERAFEFVRDECRISILPPHSRVIEYVRLIEDLPEEPSRLGQILTRCGSVTAHELETALRMQSSASAAPIGTILVQQGAVAPAVVEAALARQARLRDAKAQEGRSIRIDADKLDRLINLVGELIISAARADLVGRRTRNVELQECTSSLSGLVQEVRDTALQLRMVKIAATFNRFQRVVHDVARELGKDIALEIAGEETELDKTVVEKISDPLMHLVRNAIDHGIESAERRVAAGKSARGTVSLNAYHDSGSIIIEVSDDGGGINRDRIVAKAVERGLIEPGRTLSDRDVFALVFEPGLSTVEQVTNLSGRGVGMDVVKRNIEALRGAVEIASEEGVGTAVTVRLPLTLAIINGFLVGLGDSVFVIPLETIDECLEFTAEPGHDYTNVRGQALPFVRLREVFGLPPTTARRESIVVVNSLGRRAGIVVDTLLGEFQTVIKPLGTIFSHLRFVSGSTILGNGNVALILDAAGLIQHVGHATATPSTGHDVAAASRATTRLPEPVRPST